jgi:hypothetical protein
MAVICTPIINDKNIPTFSISRTSKNYPNGEFWFENTYMYHLATLKQEETRLNATELV